VSTVRTPDGRRLDPSICMCSVSCPNRGDQSKLLHPHWCPCHCHEQAYRRMAEKKIGYAQAVLA
jgi:hypothetical protein